MTTSGNSSKEKQLQERELFSLEEGSGEGLTAAFSHILPILPALVYHPSSVLSPLNAGNQLRFPLEAVASKS